MDVYDSGIRLKQLRKKKGLSQEEVAKRLDVTKNTISAYERNIINPKLELLIGLAVLYNTSVDYILGLSKRTHIYIDDCTSEQQKLIINVVESIKKDLNIRKTGDWNSSQAANQSPVF